MNAPNAPPTLAHDPALDDEDDGLCDVCGGEGWIMAWEGDGSDWGEDTYAGPMDESIICRHCNGTGSRLHAPAPGAAAGAERE